MKMMKGKEMMWGAGALGLGAVVVIKAMKSAKESFNFARNL